MESSMHPCSQHYWLFVPLSLDSPGVEICGPSEIDGLVELYHYGCLHRVQFPRRTFGANSW
jgi:hypothetical protein